LLRTQILLSFKREIGYEAFQGTKDVTCMSLYLYITENIKVNFFDLGNWSNNRAETLFITTGLMMHL
jgi:hypothetical protein